MTGPLHPRSSSHLPEWQDGGSLLWQPSCPCPSSRSTWLPAELFLTLFPRPSLPVQVVPLLEHFRHRHLGRRAGGACGGAAEEPAGTGWPLSSQQLPRWLPALGHQHPVRTFSLPPQTAPCLTWPSHPVYCWGQDRHRPVAVTQP